MKGIMLFLIGLLAFAFALLINSPPAGANETGKRKSEFLIDKSIGKTIDFYVFNKEPKTVIHLQTKHLLLNYNKKSRPDKTPVYVFCNKPVICGNVRYLLLNISYSMIPYSIAYLFR